MRSENVMVDRKPDLARELATYQRMLPELTAASEGRFVVISGDDSLGIFDTYPDALSAGYASRGLEPFLVKKISSVEVISYFSRDLRRVCLTSLTS